ncbi:reverse transcriptase-like protein [Bacillus weihaiensis]|uniref:reverse transcriptase-like protein n=1 Tax=Bacillus weihaiensis TaxID=1547283 RepID=UPI00308110F4
MFLLKYRIEWVYLTKKKAEAVLSSDFITLNEAIIFAEDFLNTGRVKELTFFSEDDQSWTLKELKKLTEILVDEPHDVVAYFDGGFQKHTGDAGYGVVIYFTQIKMRYRIRMNEKVEGLDSNNEAEYAAMAYLVDVLHDNDISKQSVIFKGDSQVVLNQLSGEWPCYEEEFNKWLDKIEGKLAELKIKPIYEAIPRKDNDEADKLATQAINGIQINSKSMISEEK